MDVGISEAKHVRDGRGASWTQVIEGKCVRKGRAQTPSIAGVISFNFISVIHLVISYSLLLFVYLGMKQFSMDCGK